jgi:hypothetical protein
MAEENDPLCSSSSRELNNHQDREGPPRLLNVREAARWLGVSVSVLNKMRGKVGGPIFVKVSATRVAYRPGDLSSWLETRTRRSTSDTQAGSDGSEP